MSVMRTVKQAHKAVCSGKTVQFVLDSCHGYLGLCRRTIVFTPKQFGIAGRYAGMKHLVECFRFDNYPYENPRWEVVPDAPTSDI